MQLKATRLEYRSEDAGGYGFDVVAEHHPDRGWSATVTMRTSGFETSQGAIAHLLYSAKAFERQVKEAST